MQGGPNGVTVSVYRLRPGFISVNLTLVSASFGPDSEAMNPPSKTPAKRFVHFQMLSW